MIEQCKTIADFAKKKLGWNGVTNSKILSVFIQKKFEKLEKEANRLLKCENNLRTIYEERLKAVKEANMVFRYFGGKLMLCSQKNERKNKNLINFPKE